MDDLFLVGRASAGTFFGALSNFDAVNDTLSPCNGFEIELDDIQSKDVTFTFDFQRYGRLLAIGYPPPRGRLLTCAESKGVLL